MRADLLKLLLRAHVQHDEVSFRRAAMQLAAAEDGAGHVKVADEIRSIVASLETSTKKNTIVDIAQPRGELSDILEGGYRNERLQDIILSSDTHEELHRVLIENRSRKELEQYGVKPRRHLLLYGPPGCGKTLAASVLAGELGVPLMTVRLDALFSRFLGATATQLRTVFAEMPRRPGVYLFDEFDSVGKMRGDAQDVGEVRRVVTTFLQLVDSDRSNSILVAATNHPELLDRAVYRRFDVLVRFEMPTEDQTRALLALRLGAFDLPSFIFNRASSLSSGMSFADVGRACDDAIRSMAIRHRKTPDEKDIEDAFKRARARIEKHPSTVR